MSEQPELEVGRAKLRKLAIEEEQCAIQIKSVSPFKTTPWYVLNTKMARPNTTGTAISVSYTHLTLPTNREV